MSRARHGSSHKKDQAIPVFDADGATTDDCVGKITNRQEEQNDWEYCFLDGTHGWVPAIVSNPIARMHETSRMTARTDRI